MVFNAYFNNISVISWRSVVYPNATTIFPAGFSIGYLNLIQTIVTLFMVLALWLTISVIVLKFHLVEFLKMATKCRNIFFIYIIRMEMGFIYFSLAFTSYTWQFLPSVALSNILYNIYLQLVSI
jgi:hypothetical protein